MKYENTKTIIDKFTKNNLFMALFIISVVSSAFIVLGHPNIVLSDYKDPSGDEFKTLAPDAEEQARINELNNSEVYSVGTPQDSAVPTTRSADVPGEEATEPQTDPTSYPSLISNSSEFKFLISLINPLSPKEATASGGCSTARYGGYTTGRTGEFEVIRTLPVANNKQGDGEPWAGMIYGNGGGCGTYGAGGCGPTSISNGVNRYRAKIDIRGMRGQPTTPLTVGRYISDYTNYRVCGGGTRDEALRDVPKVFKVEATNIYGKTQRFTNDDTDESFRAGYLATKRIYTTAQVERELQSGRPVLWHTKNGCFTGFGHYLTISGYMKKRSNGTKWFIIKDPNARLDTSAALYSEVAQTAVSFWSIVEPK